MARFESGVEHAVDLTFSARSRPILRELKDPAAPRRGQVREKAAQDRRRAAGRIMPRFGRSVFQNSACWGPSGTWDACWFPPPFPKDRRLRLIDFPIEKIIIAGPRVDLGPANLAAETARMLVWMPLPCRDVR